ncbi:MAG: hypothetical protein GX298_05565, partial [Planctomycetes bacterium]|nr:hypothetical protein [Planctomycetota bacterium]
MRHTFLAVLVMGVLLCGISWGVPARPAPLTLTQPDGTRIQVVPRGDEFRNWL